MNKQSDMGRNIDFEFSVTEIKQLGKGFGMNVSVRMEGEFSNVAGPEGSDTPARYTLHAVLPYMPPFGALQIGQKFRLEPLHGLR